MAIEKATFGAGCFWNVEEIFRKTKGVKSTAVGFMGGTARKPSYTQVCSGTTGHAEVTQIGFDPKIISYKQLLDIFWKLHDPTQLNKQGPDIGKQYRSVIFYHSPEQKKAAEASKLKYQLKFSEKIVTKIVKVGIFYKTEEYHQKHIKKKKNLKNKIKSIFGFKV